MLFNSLSFLIFFPIVIGVCYVFPRFRGVFLLIASCFFYMVAIPEYILVLFLLILIDYTAGIVIESAPKKSKLFYLQLSIAANLALLLGFKYFNFANESVSDFLKFLGFSYDPWTSSLLLPIGLSFHTFQSMSYTIEVYRSQQPAERNLFIYSLYVLFFPQLVAGPIERPQQLLPQLRALSQNTLPRIDEHNFSDGLRRILWGFFKKVVVADRLAIYVDEVFNNPKDYSGTSTWIASFFFTIQIYCDFSGYSDIAIGTAKILGVRLRENFQAPYLATSLREFWERWHISLTSWFRDYVYIPLGGNRHGILKQSRNIILIFLFSGLWHGAHWGFLAWGLAHGIFFLGELHWNKSRHRLAPIQNRSAIVTLLRWFITILFVNLAWVLFRANNLQDAKQVYLGLFSGINRGALPDPVNLSVSCALIALLFYVERSDAGRMGYLSKNIKSRAYRWTWYYFILFIIIFLGEFSEQRFIYFQF